jgi:hypothetical protein
MKKIVIALLVGLFLFPINVTAKSKKKFQSASNATLEVSFIGIKYKGSWAEAQIALENKGDAEATFECCKAFLENDAGFSTASLTQGEVQSQVYNKAKTLATIGTIVGAGLGVAGAVSDSAELAYAGISAAGASTIAGAVAAHSTDKQQRSIVIDDVMRAQVFYPGIKVAGTVWFPPKKRWQGSKKPQAIHVVYNYNGKMQKVTVPIEK